MEANALQQEDRKHEKLVEVTLVTIDEESGEQVEEGAELIAFEEVEP